MLAVQEATFAGGAHDHLFLLEHPHVFTHGPSANLASNLLCDPAEVGAELVAVSRGGDVTYHGPGQLVGYPLLRLDPKHGSDGPADPVAHVRNLEQMIIETLADLGVEGAGRKPGYPGVWLDPHSDSARKICAIGVRVGRRRTMHGFALNVDPDLAYMRDHIVPCGIAEHPVTSLAAEGVGVSMREVVDAVVANATILVPGSVVERTDVVWHERPEDLSAFSRGEGPGEPVRLRGRLAAAGVTDAREISERKPEWMRVRFDHGDEVMSLKRTLAELDLVTVCEEAGCPNLSECWSDGTATFMVLGERCTRACGFCLVDTRKPGAPDPGEPERVAEAVARLGLDHAVLTMVARDDLADGGMTHVAECVRAIRERTPSTRVETLISDVKGTDALGILIAERPDVLNHNIETVARLQRAVRPSAGYVRSLSVLARGKAAGLVTKSGIIVGMGETDDEVLATLADLAAVGVDIVTIGQYLRPTSNHLPVARWVAPETFDMYARVGRDLGIGHVESSPLTRSSYHAKSAASSVDVPVTIGTRS
jgi:lipoic acid synthetase